MRNTFRFFLSIGVMLGFLNGVSATAQPPGVTPHDCAEVQWIKGLWMNTEGTQVAYLVKSPNINKNVNEYQLYVKDISDTTPSNGELLMTGAEISHLQWLNNDQRIALLISIGGVEKLVTVDVKTGLIELAFPTEESIDSFSMDDTGSTVVYSLPDPLIEKHDTDRVSKNQLADGYRIFEKQEPDSSDFATSSIYLRHRDASGTWSSPQVIVVENPFTHVKTMHPSYLHYLSVSPNGKKIALSYVTNGIPEEWLKNPFVQMVQKERTSNGLPVIVDVDSGETTLAFKMVWPQLMVWSRDGQFLFINAESPIGSRWERDDIRDHLTAPSDVNMFSVNVASGVVDEVQKRLISIAEGPTFFFPNGDVMVKASRTSVVRLHESKDGWREIDHVSLPGKGEDRFYQLTSNGEDIFGVHETVTTPDALFRYKPGQGHVNLITNLNAHFRTLRTASVETIQWTTTQGLNISGLLFFPPDYVPGRRYPLVIQTKANSGWFACDFGPFHEPSFAPQPIASSGIMYLTRTIGENYVYQAEVDKRPEGYPGGISEAVQQMDIWDSAVETLNKRGLIDDSKVGIIGFSRTGWQVEFDLAHSRVRYAAATAADNVQYSLSDYWLIPSMVHASEEMYGGPPYGKTLGNWQKYSISYNLERVHTPLLMEEMGYGVHDELANGMPVKLAQFLEITTGLRQLDKPVEMYYYPDEIHQLDHPRALQATMQRNVDWYRFWLQNYERPSPEDPDQYKRWEHLRVLRDADVKPAAPVRATDPLLK